MNVTLVRPEARAGALYSGACTGRTEGTAIESSICRGGGDGGAGMRIEEWEDGRDMSFTLPPGRGCRRGVGLRGEERPPHE